VALNNEYRGPPEIITVIVDESLHPVIESVAINVNTVERFKITVEGFAIFGFTNKFAGFQLYKNGPGLPDAEPLNVVEEPEVIVLLEPAFTTGIGFTVRTIEFCFLHPVDVLVSRSV